MTVGNQQRTLVWAWLALVVLSGAAIVTGHSFWDAVPRMVLASGLLMLSFLKASLVLTYYLELRYAPRWNRALHLALGILLLSLLLLTGFR